MTVYYISMELLKSNCWRSGFSYRANESYHKHCMVWSRFWM